MQNKKQVIEGVRKRKMEVTGLPSEVINLSKCKVVQNHRVE